MDLKISLIDGVEFFVRISEDVLEALRSEPPKDHVALVDRAGEAYVDTDSDPLMLYIVTESWDRGFGSTGHMIIIAGLGGDGPWNGRVTEEWLTEQLINDRFLRVPT